jgi:hypothetical protein
MPNQTATKTATTAVSNLAKPAAFLAETKILLVTLHDHLIIGKGKHTSLRSLGLF